MHIDTLKIFKDERGDLIPIEFKDLPFIPKRIFIVKNCDKGTRRGEHAHFTTQQYLICLKGHIKVVTHNGEEWNDAFIKEGEAVMIKDMHWDYQEFLTGEDILLVICSTPFIMMDYILDFNEFKKLARKEHEHL